MSDGTGDSGLTVKDRHAAMHAALRQRICLLDYPPGMQLSEITLANEFGTSRTPMRRVLARLEEEGLVQSVHGVGTIVTDANFTELEQAYRLRVELTALTGLLDPVMPDTTFLARLKNLIDRAGQMAVSGTPKSFTQLDMDVFQALLELTENEPLRHVLERLYYQTKRLWLVRAIKAELDLEEEYRIFLHELEAIHIALQSADLAAVAQIQRAHISMSFNRLLQHRD
ncbi:GntR family transcriptional regulator [Marivita sp. XM-24bin2]|jgi:DNA-binding GntR family transcriptional regulator|uniref:GntR family transcriptional regulator n=1 Tax=unclassified Marivita TaxID=2632480 RepID=UPI000D7A73C0|nr:GntR family transcriptional regulator [Marivita sp. XM-24bin2]MCR9109119.1 GntR family transcriptional regulator [Paracoccaceae bacterium]PWL36879.1 MAG: GntR family transcriptional regulator [Marivita sp. XM-24bin2]